MSILSVVRNEALAYLKFGLLVSTKRWIPENEGHASLGVLFVPGVNANASQFTAIKRALVASGVRWFDTFEYFSLKDPVPTAKRLQEKILALRTRCERLLVVGHSLGGLLAVMVAQDEATPADTIAGLVSICAPLRGTWRSEHVPPFRSLLPDSPLIAQVQDRIDRLDPLRDNLLMIGSRYDQFIVPNSSAFLEGFEHLCLENVGHASALFDAQVQEAIVRVTDLIRASCVLPFDDCSCGERHRKISQ